ncbi:hypothetical protein [Aneurinibacillus soli]|uniref:hypothetical protein n=1 Tax=Aneurinibacillus soli TaxID=1500254 RepID=UPI001E63E89D|nr:hypothetical protein [Aneurinibacillus soli]
MYKNGSAYFATHQKTGFPKIQNMATEAASLSWGRFSPTYSGGAGSAGPRHFGTLTKKLELSAPGARRTRPQKEPMMYLH